MSKFLLVIGGPTASGKTDLAIHLARQLDTVILSADSRQFYRELSIGSAKPSPEELTQARHFFINTLSIQSEYSIGQFERDALELLARLFQEKDLVILTGGSGMYIKALCEGLDEFPKVPIALRKELDNWYRKEGLKALQSAVREQDPDYFEKVDQQNPARLLRALGVIRVSGKPFSSFLNRQQPNRPFTPVYLQTAWPRAELYDRINQRVDRMLEKGLIEEAGKLLPYRDHTALQTVGYQELFDYFDGSTDLETTVELIKQNSRRYAKRQLTWARRDGFWKSFHPREWKKLLRWIERARLRAYHFSQNKETLSLLEGKNPLASGQLILKKRHWHLQIEQAKEKESLDWLLHEARHRAEGEPIELTSPPSVEPFME